ncbi:MAG: ABC transporter ATP-binding protein [Planctomycetota bacterium]|nr:ABC transporter ATP-binding protein [Planctomycetota bacterium]
MALNGVTIDIFAEVTALVGPSGEGKTTTLNLLGGLDSPTAGHVLVFGVPLRYQDSAAMQSYRGEIPAWIFQEMNLVSHQTALGNVALGLLCRGVARRKAMRAAMQNLELLGIAHLAKRYPSQLSRGQQQRVAIARAFTSDAKIILADEPTGSLDPATAEAVMVEFRRLSTRTGKPVVLVTHNHSLAQCYCDRVLECTRNGLRDITEQRERADADEQHRPAADLDIPNDRVERGQPAVVSSSLPCSR